MTLQCGVTLFASRHCTVAGYYKQPHDRPGSTKDEEIFKEISLCGFLKGDYDQWIQVSRAHTTERVNKKNAPISIRKHKDYSALYQSLNMCQHHASHGRLIFPSSRSFFLGLEIPT